MEEEPVIASFVQCLLIAGLAVNGTAQTTMGVIRGRVLDAVDGAPLNQVQIICAAESGAEFARITSDSGGYYLFPLVPPGGYQLRVSAASYQSLEVHNLTVPVSGTVEQDFHMRSLTDLFEQFVTERVIVPGSRSVVRFYGPDLDLSRIAFLRRLESDIYMFEPSISSVVDPVHVRDLPFPGRDVYTMLLTQSGVTSDSGTQRSLGLNANGQRPSSSNFLIDGLELNNRLIAGPLIAVPPEAVQEYRISVNGYSAEFGRTAGFLANVVTRSGGPSWHGTAYAYARREWLNANDFQNNLQGLSRPRTRENQLGCQLGGGLAGNRVRVSTVFEYLANASRQAAQDYVVPGNGFLNFLHSLPVTNRARQLLATYSPPPSVPIPNEPFAGVVKLAKRVTTNRYIGIQRLDTTAGSKHRLMARLITSRLDWPDFIWSPYETFTSGLGQLTISFGGTAITTLSEHITHEMRFGANSHTLAWGRAEPDVPTLTVSFGNPGALRPLLPGSPAAYSFRNHVMTNELVSNFVLWRGSHLIKFGTSALFRSIGDDLPYGTAGRYDFPSLPDFAFASRMTLFTSLDRVAFGNGRHVLPALSRQFRNRQAAAFFQDSIRLTPRTTLNAGIRYEYLGAPTNRNHTEAVSFQFASGTALRSRLAGGSVVNADIYSQPVYNADRKDLGIRLGFAWDLRDPSARGPRPVLRGGYGVFFDQTFDNVWLNVRNNSFIFPSNGFPVPDGSSYVAPVSDVIGKYSSDVSPDFPSLTIFDPRLRDGAVHHYFLGIQAEVTRGATLEISGIGSVGRNLLSTDIINRQFSVPTNLTYTGGCDFSRYQPCLPDMIYHSSAGWSSYNALTSSVRFRSPYGFLSVTYTLGHAIDNQSDPLKGNFFDLTFAPSVRLGGFSQQFDSNGDRGNADFDQRHNLVLYSIWNLPAPTRLRAAFRDWKVAQIAAFRSGFPFSVTDQITEPSSGGILLTRRADVISPQTVWLSRATSVPGGELLMNIGSFCAAPVCSADRSQQGKSGRNAFRGPGLYNIDVSISRSFLISALRKEARFTIRADAFNVLNHANLGSPSADITSPSTFGVALYGRQLRDIGLPSLLPLRETARQVQIQARFDF